jgi:hypothetical protein
MSWLRTVPLVLVAALVVPLGLGNASAEEPPVVGEMDYGEEFQTGNCRVECNGDFPCCYYFYIAGIESFYWCAV